MRAGRLHNTVQLQQRSLSQNALGEATETWSLVASLRADIRMANGMERFASRGDTEQAVIDYVVRMRYRSGVSPLNRLVYGSKVLDIVAALDPDGRGRDMVLHCRELVGETYSSDVEEGNPIGLLLALTYAG